MSTCSILLICAGIMAADVESDAARKGRSESAAPRACVRMVSSESIRLSAVGQVGLVRPAQVGIQQTGHTQVFAAPVTCAPVACTPVNFAGAAMQGCGQSYGSSCAHACGNNCPCSCREQTCCDRCKNRCRWHRAHTTGDMFPHFAYYPHHHGYYYFRPYNWMHIIEHQARIVGMGGDSRNPYSIAMFDAIYEDFEQRFPQIIDPPAGSIQPLGNGLPNVEDLLDDRE